MSSPDTHGWTSCPGDRKSGARFNSGRVVSRVHLGLIRFVAVALISVCPLFNPLIGQTYSNNNNSDPEENGANGVCSRVLHLFETGRIAEAEHLALKVLDTGEGLTKSDRARLHGLLAFCAIANDDKDNGVRQFVQALKLNPNLSPDPITWSPKVKDIFDQASIEYRRQVELERQFRWAREADICRAASLKSLYLPGSGQRAKGRYVQGTIIGALFWGCAATFLYSHFALPQARDRYRDATTAVEACDRWKDYRAAYYLTTVSGLLTAAVYIYAFGDALWSKPVQAPADSP